MHAFVVLGLVFSIPSQEIGLGKRLQNGLFCVKWAVKTTTQSINRAQSSAKRRSIGLTLELHARPSLSWEL